MFELCVAVVYEHWAVVRHRQWSQSSRGHPEGNRITPRLLGSNYTFFYFRLALAEHMESLLQPKMATNHKKNVFSSPWNDSDMVLVVEDHELHVHKWILTSQSPVFKAMFDGHFREAGEDKITLKEKDFQSMVQFMKLLYPSSMFRSDKSPLNEESLLSIMVLADEYQCVNLIQQCIDQVKITQDNVLHILPYAVKYYKKALPSLYSVISLSTSTSKLEEVLSTLEGKEISESNKMLVTKCRVLESNIVLMQDTLISMIRDILSLIGMPTTTQAKKAGLTHGLPPAGAIGIGRTNKKDTRCPHSISVQEIRRARSCIHCKENYKEMFISNIPSCKNTQNFFIMLQRGDKISTGVNEHK